MRTNIEFGGFYGSVHESLVESAVEHIYGGDYESDPEFDYDVDWQGAYKNYIKEYASNFSEWLNDEFNLSVSFDNLELKSPKEYNFRTDTIDADITEVDKVNLVNRFIGEPEFIAYLSDATKSVSGFMSFYTLDDALADKDGVLVQYLLRYLCDKFNESELEYYFDRNCSFDNLIN